MRTNSITMPRILGLERKNREQIRCSVEDEILTIMRKHTLDTSDTINVALEKHLKNKGLLR